LSAAVAASDLRGKHAMAGTDQILDDGRSNPASCSGDEYAHFRISSGSLESNIDPSAILVK